MGCAALAQVDLDREWRPPPLMVADHHEVDREAAEHTLPGETVADLGRLPADRVRVTEVRWEPTAKVALTAGPSEQLIVRGEHLDLAERRDAKLDTRATELRAVETLLDDASALRQ